MLLVGLVSTGGWARRTAQRTRELLMTEIAEIAEPEGGAVHDRDSTAAT